MGSELEPQPAESGKTTEHPRFAVVRKGFDPKEVDEFVNRIAERIRVLEAALEKDRAAAEAEPQGANAGEATSSDRLSKRVAGLITAGEHEAETMVSDAKAEADTMVSEAASDADRILGTARDEAVRSVAEALSFLEQAKEESDRTLADLAERRQQMIEKLQQTQERLLSVAHDLELDLAPEADVPDGSA